MFDITLAQGYSFFTMLIVAVAAVGLAGVFYWRAFGMLRRDQWIALLVLRAIAILIVVLLFFRPVFSYYKDVEELPSLVFLLDSSESMSIADDATGVTRFNQARQQVEKWWETLEKDFSLRLVDFSERAREVENVAGELPGVLPDGKATSLSRAMVLGAKLTDEDNQRIKPEAIVLLSDGIHNSARSPLELSMRMPAPVYAVGVGASLKSDISYRDIQLTGFDCPERMLLNNVARVTASVEGVGLAGRLVQVVLEEDGQVIGEQELELDQIEGSQKVTFEFRPETEGRHTYTVRVPPEGDEKIDENNERSAVAMVVESGIRVLYVEGTIRAEYGALVQRFLNLDPDLEFCALVQTRPNVFLTRSNAPDLQLDGLPSDAETFDKFNVFIIGDLDASYLRGRQEMIVERVRQGAGLVMLGGYHGLGPGGYAGTPIGDIVPVRLGGREVGQVTETFLPQLTPDGTVHPIFANIGRFFPTRQGPAKSDGLPPLDGCTRVEGPKPGATVLAEFPQADGAMPVLAVQPVDKGRAAVFCGDTTRKWQQGPRAMDQDSPFLRFWGQMVRWLAGQDEEVETGASVAGATDKGYYEPEEPIHISAVVRDEQGEGAREAQVKAIITHPSGRNEPVTLVPVPGPAGHYAADFDETSSGEYKIVVEARVGQLTKSTDPIVVEVGRPNMEFEKLDLDEKLLARIATDSGGRYFHITTADQLIKQLDREQRNKRVYVEQQLYWPPLFWTIFVAVLTVEWVLRRQYQLR